MTYLDHDHRKGENVRFLAVFPITPNLGRGPLQLHTEAVLKRRVLHGIQVFGDLCKAEIRDPNVTGVLHQDVELVGCQCGMR